MCLGQQIILQHTDQEEDLGIIPEKASKLSIQTRALETKASGVNKGGHGKPELKPANLRVCFWGYLAVLLVTLQQKEILEE